jgi:hypothetical protein
VKISAIRGKTLHSAKNKIIHLFIHKKSQPYYYDWDDILFKINLSI